MRHHRIESHARPPHAQGQGRRLPAESSTGSAGSPSVVEKPEPAARR